MLAKSPNNISTLFCTPRILEKPIDYTLLDLTTTSPLGAGYFHKRLVHTLDCERLWFSESKTLLFLRLKSYITCVSDFIVESLQSFPV